jgi:hypothetical protein
MVGDLTLTSAITEHYAETDAVHVVTMVVSRTFLCHEIAGAADRPGSTHCKVANC